MSAWTLRWCTLAWNFGTSRASGASDGERKNGSFWTTKHPWVNRAQQPWLAASLGEGQLRFETIECQVCWTTPTCEDLGPMEMSEHPKTVPPWRVLELATRRRTPRQKPYSFVVATAVLAGWATVERPLAWRVELVRASWMSTIPF